ncbi:AIPR family protein [Actinomadura madurae]|uniref:AIPR family protein n=1 Tax=Actinomadura madurae TaxID=1993 RepID=UPI0020275FF5|nr:AIPR family protein [Actinomadura madurae]URN10015.1 AIPR family protein [Actinomadura madurae]
MIFEDDLRGYQGSAYEQRFLSRALTASAVRLVTRCDHKAAGQAVIDGSDDQGIDGVAVDESSRDVWLFQAKWSDAGKGKMDQGEALKFIEGLRLIERREFEGTFNDKFEPFKGQLDVAMGDARLRITLVIAVMGPPVLSDAVEKLLKRTLKEFNHRGPMLDYRVIGVAEFHEQLRQDLAPSPIDVDATMSGWIKRETPFEAWQGTVAVRDVAQWYSDHGDGLYEQNVRKSLGLTRINSGIKETLLNEPENFWYFNNGITVLCDSIEPHWPGRRRPDEPVRLTMKGVSVVNGAQTVSAIHEAMQQDEASVDEADVTVRAFSLGQDRPAYAKRITETTNTQNDVSQRDFIALDVTQAAIREDFLLSLGKTYVYKRGEPDPSPDAGCSVEHAAVALACAHRSPDLAVRASQGTGTLWERGSSGAYPRLFGEQPTAYRIWRLVQARRVVGAALEAKRKELRGRAADMARRGDLLITHLVFQLLDLEDVDGHGFDEESMLAGIPGLTGETLSWLIYGIDSEYGPNSFLSTTFTDETRCKDLAKVVLDAVRRGATVPSLRDDYRPPKREARPPRRPNAVPTLVNAGRLDDGVRLTYRPESGGEVLAVKAWLDADPRRETATWVNDRRKCLLWAYDGEVYSPTGLVTHIWELAGYERSPVSVQGPRRWWLGDKSLWDLAVEIFNRNDES